MCDGCGHKTRPTTGAIIDGKFGQYCRSCRDGSNRLVSAGHAQYLRQRDREDNRQDLLQPWDGSGKPNTPFIRNYPDEAKDIFTKEELNNYG